MDADGFVKITDFGLCKEGELIREATFQPNTPATPYLWLIFFFTNG